MQPKYVSQVPVSTPSPPPPGVISSIQLLIILCLHHSTTHYFVCEWGGEEMVSVWQTGPLLSSHLIQYCTSTDSGIRVQIRIFKMDRIRIRGRESTGSGSDLTIASR